MNLPNHLIKRRIRSYVGSMISQGRECELTEMSILKEITKDLGQCPNEEQYALIFEGIAYCNK